MIGSKNGPGLARRVLGKGREAAAGRGPLAFALEALPLPARRRERAHLAGLGGGLAVLRGAVAAGS